ncbi:nucleotide-binding universal stress UspA family protein [Rhodobium orientis]|uniref:Universal stress protein UspA n=1 Tax=Rhodobium orientis TaxID=34017 RepID=A0A327JJD7_9HYPH|nr:universal stress protein [Rhodobium orientis]MBB4303888.1 nucleotide-binding universal stress UspA family protein [Rhodobium orientis]MBK5951435.1 universal stress protein UspA [Rhodobium orientis]RAI26141.1 universal stress protein UspA [Rhodobium orientis]
MTTGTLIAFVDGSKYSKSVCHYAAWLAKRLKATVKIYHVTARTEGDDRHDLSGAIQLGARSNLLAELSELDAKRAKLSHAQGRAILEDARAIVEADGVAVETRLRQGDLVETLQAKEHNGDIVVIGKRGEAADMAKGHLGSNLERVVRSSHKPVFVTNREFAPVSKILIAFDGGPSSLKAVDFLARSTLAARLPVALAFAGTETREVRKALDDARALLSAGGLDVEIVVEPGRPEAALARLVEERGYDMLVMGAYGHSRIRNLIIGSTTSEMIRTCKVPILLMR